MARNILWLGAHKTGTTYLQKSLDLSQGALRAHNVKYIELNAFREKYTRPLINGRPGMTVAANEFDTQGPGTNLVFDENIPALVQHVCTPEGVYCQGPERARRMADHLELGTPTLVLGIRSFTGFLPSLYCETLKANPFKPFRKFLRTPFKNLRWYPWVKALQGAFPGAQMLVYQYENLRGKEQALLSYVLGIPPQDFTLLGAVERPGFSHRAIRSLREMYKENKVVHKDLREAVKRYPKGAEYPGFHPWKAAEKETLELLYARDIADLQKDPTVNLLFSRPLVNEMSNQ